MEPHCSVRIATAPLNFYFTNMEQPTEPGFYWYKEPNESVKMCKVYMHEFHKHLRIIFIDESSQSFKLSVIEPGTKFNKVPEHKF